jgi:triosephosphate isomerase
MSQNKGPFIINLKNYSEISGHKAIQIANDAERVAIELDLRIIVSPPQVLLGLVASKTNLEIIGQHIDFEQVGASTGFVIPEMIKEAGAIGSIINHSEHPIDISIIEKLIERLRQIGMISLVCAKNLEELKRITALQPDFVAIEPPELIGTKRSISSEKPSLIKDAYTHLVSNGSKTKLICGAGINTPEDVRVALDLGSNGILAASSIVKADSWYEKIYELAKPF